MGAKLGNAAVLHYRDAIGATNCGEAVRDDEHGPTLHEVGERGLDGSFALGIKRGGGFVEDEDRGVLEQGAGDGEALALPAGETCSAFADHRIVALRKTLDEIVRERGLCGGGDPLHGDVGLAIGDVVANGVVEEHRLLRDFADLLAERDESEVADVVVIEKDGAAGDVVEARQKVDES